MVLLVSDKPGMCSFLQPLGRFCLATCHTGDWKDSYYDVMEGIPSIELSRLVVKPSQLALRTFNLGICLVGGGFIMGCISAMIERSSDFGKG